MLPSLGTGCKDQSRVNNFFGTNEIYTEEHNYIGRNFVQPLTRKNTLSLFILYNIISGSAKAKETGNMKKCKFDSD